MSSRSRLLGFAALCGLAPAACDSDPAGPAAPTATRLVRTIDYGGIVAGKQRGTYAYDDAGRFVRFDLEWLDELANPADPPIRHSYYSLHEYEGDRRVGGEVFILRDGVGFVRSRRWDLEFDAAGRVTRAVHTSLLAHDFSPVHQVSTRDFLYDAEGRIIEVSEPGGGRWTLEYGPGGDLVRESLHTFEGTVIRFDHTFDDGRNPYYELIAGQGGWDGLVIVVAPWALFYSPRNVVRTEITVEGREGIVSVRTVDIQEYTPEGYPRRWVQELKNTADPDGSVFVGEFEYEGGG